MRLFGDTIFAIGAVAFVYSAIGIMRRERTVGRGKLQISY
jgi:hypothetical protein